MKKKIEKIINKIQAGEKVNLYFESIDVLEYLEKDKNGNSLIEVCLQNDISIPYNVEKEFGKSIDAILLYIKYKKGIYSFNIPEEVSFSKYNDGILLDYIIENDALGYSIVQNVNNLEIIDILLKHNKNYYLNYLSQDVLKKIIKPDINNRYIIEKYLDINHLDFIINSINDPKALIEMCINLNKYNLLKHANSIVLMHKIGNITLLDDLVSKNIIPDALNDIPNDENFIKYLFNNNYKEYLRNAKESILLTKINKKETLLEIFLKENSINKINFYIYDSETINLLYKYNKLDLITNINDSFLEKPIREIFNNKKLENISLLEYLLEHNINPLKGSYSIKNEKFIKTLFNKGYKDFLLKLVNDDALLTKIDGDITILDKIIEDKTITNIKEFTSVDVANKLFVNNRTDLLACADVSTLLNLVNDTKTYLDYVLEAIKNKNINFKVIDFTLYNLNVADTAMFYITLAKHDMVPFVRELEEDFFLRDFKGVKLIDKLLELDSDTTVNKLLNDEVREKLHIAVILKSKGIDLNNVSIPLKEEEYDKTYLDNFNSGLGIGPVFNEGEVLLRELYELFNNDGKSDKDLVNALVNSYKNALILNYNNTINELRNLINVKKDNLEKFIYVKEKEDKAYFSPRLGSVHCNNTNYDTLLHETGHALHYYVADEKIPENYFDIITKSRLNPDTLKNVEAYSKKFREIKDKVYKRTEEKYKETFDNYYTADKISEIEEFLNKSLEEKKKEYKDLGFEDDVLEVILDNNFTVDEYIEQEKKTFIKEYSDSIMRSEFGAFISLGDIIDAIYLGEFKSNYLKNENGELIEKAYGHGIAYYSRDESGFHEMIANYAAISKSNDGHEMIKLLRAIVGDEVVDMIETFYYENIVNVEYNKENKKGL